MPKVAPSPSRIAVMALFAMSCFGLTLYLWAAFGGPVPLAPQGYRLEVRFNEAAQLSNNADVRISGVKVGSVISSELDRDRTRATIEIDGDYAPVPRDTEAILRLKTLLGETYVEITPGDDRSGDLQDGSTLPDAQVRPTVELDEVLGAFDPRTRRDLRRFIGGVAAALDDRGADFNAALGNASPFAVDTRDLLDTLDTQSAAVRRLVRDTGVVFDALGRRQGELSRLVSDLNTVLGTTARRNAELQETVRILPTTLRELRPTLGEIQAISGDAAPLVRDLRPGGRALAPALRDASALAPELRGLFLDVDDLTTASRTALPDATRTLRAAHPLFQSLDPLLRELHPILKFVGLYNSEVTASIAGLASSTQGAVKARQGGKPIHYLRALVPFTAEGLVVAGERFGSNRHNPYFSPRALDKLASELEAIDCRNAANAARPGGAPPCRVQPPVEFGGERNAFPHVEREP